MTKALLEPKELISRHELAGDTFEVLQLVEEGKTMPWNAVYDEFCVRNGVPVGNEIISVIKEYEKTVLANR
jgi:L-rhamnose isomerase